MTQENLKLALNHVLSDMRPQEVKKRLEQDLSSSKRHLHFQDFMMQCVRYRTCFSDIGPKPFSQRGMDKKQKKIEAVLIRQCQMKNLVPQKWEKITTI